MTFLQNLVLIATLSGAEVTNGENKGLEKELQGIWIYSNAMIDGASARDSVTFPIWITQCEYEFTDKEYSVRHIQGKAAKFTYSINEEVTPNQLDIVFVSGDLLPMKPGHTIKGIVKLQNNTLERCYSLSGKDRPVGFESREGEGLVHIQLKRKKL